MKNRSKTLLFFGNERLLSGVDFDESPILTMLIENEYKVIGVVLNKHDTKSRRQKIEATEKIAKKHNLPIYYPSNSAEIQKIIEATNPYAAILVAFGLIIPEVALDKLEGGIINVHPSLLPKYRGPSPIETALLNGDKSTGVSLMQLSEKMDAGPIYLQTQIEINESEDKISIAKKLLVKAADLLRDNLDEILDGKLLPKIQDETKATYTTKLEKSVSKINASLLTAYEAYRRIQAFKYYPKARIDYNQHQLIIEQAHISKAESGLAIKFKDDNYLVIDRLILPSGKSASGEDYLRGYLRRPK